MSAVLPRAGSDAPARCLDAGSTSRLRLRCRGTVQGVGFRPFVHRLATELGISGRARNEIGAVLLELQGSRPALERLLVRLPRELPWPGRLEPLQPDWLPPQAQAPASAPGDRGGDGSGRSDSQPTQLAQSEGVLEARGIQISASAPEPLGIGLVAPALTADLAPCAACLAELADPANRRFGYAFISCCACGPRYSIATAQPFARAHTSLAAFPPCAACRQEFHDPANRRFHAETIGCPECGPQLAWWEPQAPAGGDPGAEKPGLDLGAELGRGGKTTAGVPIRTAQALKATPIHSPAIHSQEIHAPAIHFPAIHALATEASPAAPTNAGDLIERACALLAAGGILALQGVGGFQLLVDGCNAAAIGRLRQRKRRPSKPLALLVADLAWIRPSCWISAAEREQLHHPAAPIVLLRRRSIGRDPLGPDPLPERVEVAQALPFALALEALAPGSANLGVMLPASPLHQLLAVRFGRPLVATSGNHSGDPLVSDPAEARRLLGEIADGLLVHNRPIARPLEDSLLQLIEGRPALLRRARGYAPEPLRLPPSQWQHPGQQPNETCQQPPSQGPNPTASQTQDLARVRGPAAPAQGVLALGGDLKSAPALALGEQLYLAPQLGDLRSAAVLQRLEAGARELLERHGPQIDAIAIDGHPGYLSHQLGQQLGQQLGHQLGDPKGQQRSQPMGDELDHQWGQQRSQPIGAQPAHQPPEAPDQQPSHQLAPNGLPRLQAVPHHLAHGLAVAAEHALEWPVLVLSCDGLGYGATDRPAAGPPLWGGELLLVEPGGWRRLASLRPFPLPGGERAMAEPRRAGLGLLAACGPAALAHPGARRTLAAFAAEERELLLQATGAGCNAPPCSSVGRLFDAVASLLGLCQRLDYEGQGGQLLQGAAAAGLAAAARDPEPLAGYPLPLSPAPAGHGATSSALPLGWLDWQPLLTALLDDLAAADGPNSPADGASPLAGDPNASPPPLIQAGIWAVIQRCAARFHLGLAGAAAELAAAAAAGRGCPQVALSGGCFQNRLLLEATIAALRRQGLSPFWGEAVPCNDGGLAVGQVWALRQGLAGAPIGSGAGPEAAPCA